MNSLIDQLQREVSELRTAVLAKRYGVGSEQILLVLGDQSPEETIESRMGHIPADIRSTVKVTVVHLPWMTGRSVVGSMDGGESLFQTQEGSKAKS